MKVENQAKWNRIVLRISKLRDEAYEHYALDRPVSAFLLMKTVESLNIKKLELES